MLFKKKKINKDYAQVKKDIEALIKRDWGKRCKVKDTVDFPELAKNQDSRCGCCLAW